MNQGRQLACQQGQIGDAQPRPRLGMVALATAFFRRTQVGQTQAPFA